jgi:hypothetical protein
VLTEEKMMISEIDLNTSLKKSVGDGLNFQVLNFELAVFLKGISTHECEHFTEMQRIHA